MWAKRQMIERLHGGLGTAMQSLGERQSIG